MNQRLQMFLAAEGITQSQFADEIQVAKSSVSNILAGRNNPSYDFILNLSNHYPDLNLEWVLTGKGKMYRSGKETIPQLEETPLLFEKEETEEKPQIDENPESVSNQPASAENAILADINENGQKNVENAPKRISKIIIFYDDNSFVEIR
ncbi:MAG: helix-turn-helix domain-containing protein [Bacteroidales bacterium]|nr:helix-turn-helix domain-containing protein [Bacteroidales bacterium]